MTLAKLTCPVWFRAAGMRKREMCSLPAGHAERYHQHNYPRWYARVWPKVNGGLRFEFSAKPGKSLPEYLR